MKSQIGIDKILKILTYATALIGFLSVARQIGFLYPLGFVLICLVALYGDFIKRLDLPRWLLNAIAVLMVIIGFIRMRGGNIVAPGIEILLILVALKFLERRQARDYMQIYVLSLFLLAGSSLLSLDLVFLLYIVIFLFLLNLAIITLAYFAEDPQLILDYDVLIKIFRKSILIPLLVIPATVIFFIILPRTSYPFFSFVNRDSLGMTGFTDNVILGEVSSMQQDNSIVFRVAMERIDEKMLYWRGIVFQYFDGRSWSRSNRFEGLSAINVRAQGKLVRYTVYLEPYGQKTLFTLDTPVWVGLSNVFLRRDLTCEMENPVTSRIHYNAFSRTSSIISDPELDRAFYLQLPDDNEKVSRLVRSLVAGGDEWAIISQLLNFFQREGFRYSLSNLPTSDRPLEDFLFVHKYGNCEYFASAMAVMLRSAGIPARVVGGYVGGYYNVTGKYYAIPQRNAHLWVEAYIMGSGWVRIDPTPTQISGFTSPDKHGFFFMLRMALDGIEYYWNLFVIQYNLQSQLFLLSQLQSSIRAPITGIRFPPYGILLKAIMIVVILAILAVILLQIRQRRPLEERLLRNFLRRMGKLGYPKDEAKGLEEYASSLPDSELKELVFEFIVAFEAIYYRDRQPTSTERIFLRKLLREIK